MTKSASLNGQVLVGLDLRLHKSILTATASRDLKYGVDNNLLEKYGEKVLTIYMFIISSI